MSTLSWLTPAASNGISADAEVTVGKKEETNQIQTQLGDQTKSEQKAQAIVNNYGLSTWQMVIFALIFGWAIPSPFAMLRGAKNMWRLWRE